MLTVDRAPLNALSLDVRAQIIQALDRAAQDDAAQVIVVMGAGNSFPAGQEAAEFNAPPKEPSLRSLCTHIEMSDKPVIAAIHGSALGGGFELALAAHYRVALKTARIGLPEVTLGMVPAGGATQRLPRLTGAGRALDMMLGGKPMAVSDKAAKPLIDALAEGDIRAAGLAMAQKIASDGKGVRRSRDATIGFSEPLTYQAKVTATQESLNDIEEDAPGQILRCVEAAQLLPFDVGVEFEAELAETCRQSPQSAALRHVFFAERRVGNIPEVAKAKARALSSVGILGGGSLSVLLAIVALDAGLDVRLHGRDPAMSAQQRSQIEATYERAVQNARMERGVMQDRMARLEPTENLAAICGCDLIVETTGADAASRGALMQRLFRQADGQTIVATAGPCAELAQMAADSGASGRVVGLRFLTPAHITRMVEVCVHDQNDAASVVSTMALIRKMGRVAIRTAPMDSTVGASIMQAMVNMALTLMDQGVHPYQIEAALHDYGFKTGVFHSIDMAGLPWAETGLRSRGMAENKTLSALIALGRGGRAQGKGFFLYPKGQSTPEPDETLGGLLSDVRPMVQLPDATILRLLGAAMANQGAALLRAGAVLRASDLDVAMIHGHGFPRLRGGPMKAADLTGLFEVQRTLQAFAAEAGDHWAPDPYLLDLVKNGRRFAS